MLEESLMKTSGVYIPNFIWEIVLSGILRLWCTPQKVEKRGNSEEDHNLKVIENCLIL